MRDHQGKGKLDFLLTTVLFGLLAALLLGRLIDIEREAERTEVELTLRNMRVGLQLAIGERLMRGQEDRLAELLEANPVGFLGRRPSGYRGETSNPDRPGTWRFDPATRALIYLPGQPEAFEGRRELRWQMASRGERGGRVVGIQLESLSN